MIDRRGFLKNTSLIAALLAIDKNLFAAPKRKINAGLQLYAVRDFIENDAVSTIKLISDIGYKEVETYGYPYKGKLFNLKPKDFKSLLDDNSISSPSGHYDLNEFLSTERKETLLDCISTAKILGSKYVVVPSVSSNLTKNASQYKLLANRLNKAGDICKKEGLKLAYHNHDVEFKKFGDSIGLEILLQQTDPALVAFELDLYWAAYAKCDVKTLFETYPSRFKMWHIKDMDLLRPDLNTEIGNGKLDFMDIFSTAKIAGVKHIYVEQDNNYKFDSLRSAQTSFRNLSTILSSY